MSGNDGESRAGVPLTNLDQPLFDGADATKRDLVEYLDAVRDRIIPELEDRPLSVIRVHRGQEAFMQKNVPKYTPSWVRTVQFWAETSKRDVSYALCNDRRTLLWFANQRAVEYHPTLVRVDRPDRITHLVLDLDPPTPDAFPLAVAAARLVRQALGDAGRQGAGHARGQAPSPGPRPMTARLLRSPWPCLSAGCIEGDRGTDERLERAGVDLLPLVDVNRAPCVPLEARVEELGWVLQ